MTLFSCIIGSPNKIRLVFVENITNIRIVAVFFFSKYLKDGALKIGLRGVEYMNDDPSEVDVLYAKVNNGDQR